MRGPRAAANALDWSGIRRDCAESSGACSRGKDAQPTMTPFPGSEATSGSAMGTDAVGVRSG